MVKTISQEEEEYVVTIPLDEYKSIKGLATSINDLMTKVMSGQVQIADALKIMANEIAHRDAIVIPAPVVTVKAAEVQMPETPPAQIHMMSPEGKHKFKFKTKIIRDGRGMMTGSEVEGTIE